MSSAKLCPEIVLCNSGNEEVGGGGISGKNMEGKEQVGVGQDSSEVRGVCAAHEEKEKWDFKLFPSYYSLESKRPHLLLFVSPLSAH